MGYNFIWYMPVLFKCCVLRLRIKIVADDNIIPKQSKKIVKLKMVSNSFAQKIMSTQMLAKTVKETVSTPVLSFVFLNMGGNILSSLIANITLGLLINSTFT